VTIHLEDSQVECAAVEQFEVVSVGQPLGFQAAAGHCGQHRAGPPRSLPRRTYNPREHRP
jgi:hypothetical protein